jgi:hypothetical protein
LRTAQDRLVQTEKLASLGQLTAQSIRLARALCKVWRDPAATPRAYRSNKPKLQASDSNCCVL